MIEKKIHYCWFGRGKLPKKAKRCIASWKKYCSDYEIIEWNEDNFDINMNPYTKMCYEQKKYAFLTDYVRLVVIEKHGGIYFDTDVEVIRSFDDLLDCNAFFGFENNEYIATGLGFGSEASNYVVRQMILEYEQLLDGKHDFIPCPKLNTDALLKLGLRQNGEKQNIFGVNIYPIDYFNPLNNNTGVLNITENTYSIHRYSMSWLTPTRRLRSKITRPMHRFFGEDCFKQFKKLMK